MRCVLCGARRNLERHHPHGKWRGRYIYPKFVIILCADHHYAIHEEYRVNHLNQPGDMSKAEIAEARCRACARFAMDYYRWSAHVC